jgi:hypothetical protein
MTAPHRHIVMAGLVPAIHVFLAVPTESWMAGTGPVMTMGAK